VPSCGAKTMGNARADTFRAAGDKQGGPGHASHQAQSAAGGKVA
jgi:hypothetical protein